MNQPIANLPLSWIHNNSSIPELTTVNLFSKKSVWLPLAKIPVSSDNLRTINELTKQEIRKQVIRGCDKSTAYYLNSHGFEKIIIGKEAVLELKGDHFKKKSLKELVRRGKRHGRTKNLPCNETTINQLQKFKKITAHGREPQLKYLFFDYFEENTELFVFESFTGEWLGAILISKNSTNKLHTELILRKNKAPVGIMEALISDIFNSYKRTGYQELSLGEVPFVVKPVKFSENYKVYTINKIGTSLRFAYNYKGLFNFKNKFSPKWIDLYICSKPGLSLRDLSGIILKSKLLQLFLYKLFALPKRSLQ
jgi:lysylphosphatidylglycerol synthetase-like protein (DUF2156 family)